MKTTETQENKVLTLMGGLCAISTLLIYAGQVLLKQAPAQSIATWLMWTIMDVILVLTALKAGNPIWLPLGWAVGAGTVTCTLLAHGQWHWSARETITAACALVAGIAWLKGGAKVGVVAATCTMTIAGIPLLIDMYNHPLPKTFYVWAITVVATIFTIIGSPKKFVALFLPVGSLIYNATIAVLSLH